MKTWLLSIGYVGLIISVLIPTNTAGNLYSTWEGVETDKCASSWVIRKFIDKDAQFKIFPRGAKIKEGTPFDTPDAEFRRKQGMTTFDCILKKYELTDPGLLRIAKVVKDIEINTWDKKAIEESSGINIIIRGLDLIIEDDLECLRRSWVVLDALYAFYTQNDAK
jgi:hypothetical protein